MSAAALKDVLSLLQEKGQNQIKYLLSPFPSLSLFLAPFSILFSISPPDFMRYFFF
jgi:hypothetical protein